MVTENSQQARFSHEEWVDQLSHFWVTFKLFITEFLKVLKVLFQKGKNEAWKEIRSSSSKLQKKRFCMRRDTFVHWTFWSLDFVNWVGSVGLSVLPLVTKWSLDGI